MDNCLQWFGYFHTKKAFSRGHLETNWFSNFLILLRVKQHVYGEHKLKFLIQKISHISKLQECLGKKTYILVHLLSKRSYHDKGNAAVLKCVDIF